MLSFILKQLKNYVPVEFVKKSDMLIDYQGYNVQIISNEPIEFKANEYYSIQINSPADVVVPFLFKWYFKLYFIITLI